MSADPRRTRLARLAPRVVAAAPRVLLVVAFALYAASTYARPGGGQSFGGRSGGGSSGGHVGGFSPGGGGGGRSGDCSPGAEIILYLLIQLPFQHPLIGIPLDLVVLAVVIAGLRQTGHKGASWSTSSSNATDVRTQAAERAATYGRPARAVRRDLLSTAGRQDPDFSIVLFEDFLYALYATTHEARGKGELATLAAYIAPEMRQRLMALASGQRLTEVQTPVIGALRYVSVAGFGPTATLEVVVEIEANYTEVGPDGAHTFYVVDQWTLTRAPGVRSKPPGKASIIGCPNCGAPLSELRGSTCSYCKQVVDTGAFDWVVAIIETKDRMERGPQLTADTEETGTNLPTAVEPDASMRREAISRRDPSFQWPHFLGRVAQIFDELQPAWSTLEWERARPFVSDQLFQMLAYWIETYKRQHLRNVNENARITGVELAAVVSDRWYDAITVRVHATGFDYTVSDDGHVVSGSKTRERVYTEYWTLVRGSGARTTDKTGKECPNCGAPLAINMAGSCTHCHAKVTSGEFDWVLSRIEQDEAYTG